MSNTDFKKESTSSSIGISIKKFFSKIGLILKKAFKSVVSFFKNPVKYIKIANEKRRAVINDVYTPLVHNPENILEVNKLKMYFPIKAGFFKRTVGYVKAVDGISFNIKKGTTMGLVGESGCGKTTAGRTILRLYERSGGQVLFDGEDINKLKGKKLRAKRPELQIVFQDPYSSLSPRLPVGEIIGEAVREHKIVPKDQYDEYITKTMEACGLQEYHKDRYPHEFSGGQRQRICIARALALDPKFIVCDEPVSALDVSIQAQIINLLKDLQEKFGLTYLFISHDLSVVEHISDTVGVMYLGSMVEFAPTKILFKNPKHPYTEALFSAIPVPDPDYKMKRIILEGNIPSPANPPSGCKFHTRCRMCMEVCKSCVPNVMEIEPDHFVVCHLFDKEALEKNKEMEKELKAKTETKSNLTEE
ncbi:MAG: ABC transporter ATP-binding protein [Clostridia bacterium]|nr:ABC transporter ATP-binding protein [Clostridia bacterium]